MNDEKLSLGSQFADYRIEEYLGEGSKGRVYRVSKGGQSYALKVIKNVSETDEVESKVRFKKEMATFARCNHKSLARIIDFGEYQKQLYLLMELVSGRSLQETMNQALSKEQIVGYASSISAALDEIHRMGLIHRDVKPDNIVISEQDGAKLIDFDLGGDEEELEESFRNQALVGTFQYSAPEQLGALKRRVDRRSDLYSLGVVLYRAATGRLPFESEDVGALINMHASRVPQSILELKPDASPVLAEIIAKLLKKDPEERYQSAGGLKFDLENLVEFEDRLRLGEALSLGRRDFVGAQQAPLLGRQKEIEDLKKHLEEAAKSYGRCLLIEGEAGLGKSRLTREIIKAAASHGMTIISTKCSPLERDIPLAAIRQALDQYTMRISKQEGAARSKSAELIIRAAGESATMVAGLSDGLRKILGLPVQIEAGTDRISFLRHGAQFFMRMAQAGPGLVLLVDDVQWLDEVSRDLIAELSQQMGKSKLLVIGTARNDTESVQAVSLFKEMIAPSCLHVMSIEALTFQGTSEVLRSHLGEREVDAAILEKLYALSHGNPLVLIEYISKLISSGCLYIQQGCWMMDMDQLGIVDLSQDIYELVLSRFKSLQKQTQTTLRMAAVTGFSFKGGFLSRLLGQKKSDVRDALSEAVNANVIESVDVEDYKFIHDRVREAILSDLSEEVRRGLHDQIVDLLQEEVDENSPQVYDLARHSAAGNKVKNPKRCFQHNYAAGRYAQRQFARHEAYAFFTVCSDLEVACELDEPTKFAFYKDFGSTCVEAGYLPKAAEYFEKAMTLAHDANNKSLIYSLQCNALMHEGQYSLAWSAGLKAMETLGSEAALTGLRRLVAVLANVVKGYFFAGVLRRSADPERCRLLATAYERQGSLAFFMNRKPELLLMGFRQFYFARLLGDSRELVRAHSYLAILYAVILLRPMSRFHIRQAFQVADRLNDRAAQIGARYNAVFAIEFMGDATRAEKMGLEVLGEVEKNLGAYDIALITADMIVQFLLRGYHRQSVDKIDKYMPLVDQLNRVTAQAGFRAHLFCQLIILGHITKAAEAFNELAKIVARSDPAMKFITAKLPAVQFISMYETEDLSPDIEKHIQEFKKLNFDHFQHKLFYAWIGYIRLAQAEKAASGEERSRAVIALEQEVASMRRRFKTSVSRCHYLILLSALRRLRGEVAKAKILLNQAEALAYASDSVFAQFMILRERGLLAKVDGRTFEAQVMGRMAQELAAKHGWVLRAQRIAKEFGLEAPSAPKTIQDSGSIARSSLRNETYKRIMNALLRVNLASSLELDPRRQVEMSLDEINKVMGAERSYVFLLDSETGTLNFSGGRDVNGQNLQNLTGYSSTVVQKVMQSKVPMIVTGSDQMEALGSKSAIVQGLRSIMAAPLMLKGEFRGVIYVDSAVAKGLFSEPDIEVLSAIGNQITIAFESVRMMNVEASRREMQKDLALSAVVQKMLLPRVQNFKTDSFEMAGFYRPAVQCGGDWWWHDSAGRDGQFRAFVGDVTGHGAGPAMITSYIAACFNYGGTGPAGQPLPDLMKTTSQMLHHMTKGDFLMSSVGLEIDLKKKQLHSWHAGCPGFFVMRADGRVDLIQASGYAMGLENFEPRLESIQLHENDRVYIMTDGILEMPTQAKGPFGARRTKKLFEQTRGMNVSDAVEYMVREIDKIRGNVAQDDDITMVLFEVKGGVGA